MKEYNMKRFFIFSIMIIVCLALLSPLTLMAQKKRVAVFEFDDKTDHRVHWWSGQSVGRGMSDMLVTALVKSGKYQVMERSALDKIMQEQKLGMTGMVTQQSAAQVGKLLGVQVAVIGSVTEFGHSKGSTGGRIKNVKIGVSKQSASVAIDVRFINVNTGEILLAENIRKQKSKSGLSFGTPKFSFNNKNKFDQSIVGKATRDAIESIMKLLEKQSIAPGKFEGKVIKVAGGQVYINRGAQAGVNNGDVFVIYAKGEELIDPDTGLSLGSEDTKIGKIKVTNNSVGDGKASICVVVQGSGFARGNLVRKK
jgi:curli biogenesis system outer membrane secretion channel CsgG